MTRLTAGALEPATSPLEIAVTLGAGAVFRIGAARAAAAVPASSTKTSMVLASEELFNQVLVMENAGIREVVLGFKILGNKALVGSAYIRNIFSLTAIKKGATSPRALLAHFEAEGIANGAETVKVFGHTVVNQGLLSLDPKLLSRLGWELEWVSDGVLMLTKRLR